MLKINPECNLIYSLILCRFGNFKFLGWRRWLLPASLFLASYSVLSCFVKIFCVSTFGMVTPCCWFSLLIHIVMIFTSWPRFDPFKAIQSPAPAPSSLTLVSFTPLLITLMIDSSCPLFRTLEILITDLSSWHRWSWAQVTLLDAGDLEHWYLP